MVWLAVWLLGTALAFAGVQVRAQGTGSPEALVKKVTDEVLTAIKADASVQSGNPQRLLQLVDEKVLPYVDFEKTTRLAAGRYWRQATPEQQKALIKEFRTTLVRTYSGAVSSVKQQTTVELRPSHYPPEATDVVVRTLIKQPAGDPIPVDYRMEKEAQGWKIYDVNVLGVWLIENYRNQFSQQISQNGIDGLIKSLADRNRQFESAR
ncbi:MAG: ABC transporter substrate-binding protein [Pigmentiphaga sp.]|uniref:MlaC/ttg2D family ABC transporter substrate-binding protein n=1 Tax=Pigmentiphaga sp. TaxID=1977564 RepID=UPI0029AE585C|nr:ABC transporter substrate-binding protein [Pigmentiphaga sp.]MDX3907987.1 ABC transporter substrate-binding protein [Pigmentiphaga sp.]